MLISITPVPQPRQSQRDRWKPRNCVLRYRAFCDELRLKTRAAGMRLFPERVRLDFTIAMPLNESWSGKRREETRGQPHQAKPDLDNLIKAVLDALMTDDSVVYEIHATKIWGDHGCIKITDLSL